MANYINRDELEKHLVYEAQMLGTEQNRKVLKLIKLLIRNIPTADVVEVVRCKDCAFRGGEDCSMYYKCECGEQHTWEGGNDFCSWGKRK